MNSVHVGLLRRADNLVDFQVALRGTRGTDTDSAIGDLGVSRVAIRFATDDDRFHAKLMACANHAERNFAAIGD